MAQASPAAWPPTSSHNSEALTRMSSDSPISSTQLWAKGPVPPYLRATGLELETETSGPERPPEKPRKHDSGAADLERVTDYAEEKEIQSSNLETAMSVIGDRRSREQKAKQEREKELAKVTIKKEDLELIMTEMEISRAAAERSLREHMGNVVEALIALTN